MNLKKILLNAALIASCSICTQQAQAQTKEYENPVINVSVPDPTIIRANDGYFYLYGTEDTRNIPIYRSSDMVNWEYMNTAFTKETRPTWKGRHSLWAPEIRYIDGKYVLYYSWARWGDHWNSEVGVATADNPLGPFVDHGQIIDAKELNVENSIDQFYIEDKGKKYLFWGSFRGIYAVELNDDGLSIKRKADGTPAMLKQICGNRFEAVNIYKKGKYYYLFASIGSCCEGAKSTYQMVGGRSKNILGPYVDKEGRDMLDNHCEIIIKGNKYWAGPGHNSIVIQDDAKQEWIVYHGYPRADAHKGRVVLLDRLQWTKDGWPYVEGGVPSRKAAAPVIKQKKRK